MKDNKNKGDKARPKAQWTAEDRARHQAIRDMFRNWHPSPESGYCPRIALLEEASRI